MMKYILWYTCLKINNDTVKATLCGGRILKMGTTPRPSLHSFLTDSYGWRPTNREKTAWWQSARGDRNVQLQATRRLGEFVVQTYFKIQYVFRYTFSQLFMEIICLLARELSFYSFRYPAYYYYYYFAGWLLACRLMAKERQHFCRSTCSLEGEQFTASTHKLYVIPFFIPVHERELTFEKGVLSQISVKRVNSSHLSEHRSFVEYVIFYSPFSLNRVCSNRNSP